MAQVAPAFIGGHFFKAPPGLPGAVSKVVPEVMIGDVISSHGSLVARAFRVRNQ